jgi:hypothetical protein
MVGGAEAQLADLPDSEQCRLQVLAVQLFAAFRVPYNQG